MVVNLSRAEHTGGEVPEAQPSLRTGPANPQLLPDSLAPNDIMSSMGGTRWDPYVEEWISTSPRAPTYEEFDEPSATEGVSCSRLMGTRCCPRIRTSALPKAETSARTATPLEPTADSGQRAAIMVPLEASAREETRLLEVASRADSRTCLNGKSRAGRELLHRLLACGLVVIFLVAACYASVKVLGPLSTKRPNWTLEQRRSAMATAQARVIAFHPQGPSRAWLPRSDTCVRSKVSCSNSPVWELSNPLGDRLLDLSAVLVQAVTQNLCYAWIPPDVRAHLEPLIEFPSDGMIVDMAEPQGGARPQFNLSDIDWQRDCITDAFDLYDVARSTQLLQDFFVSTGRLKCSVADMPELGPQGVVLHMRSGGSMVPWIAPGVQPQPPCSFYEAIVQNGNRGRAFDHVLIVSKQDLSNPCIGVLQTMFASKVKVWSEYQQENACVMVNAQNLATAAWSTRDAGLIRLNSHLKTLHVPMNEDNSSYFVEATSSEHFNTWMVHEDGMPYEQHAYSFPGYDTKWETWYQRLASMRAYPKDRIVKRSIPSNRDKQKVS